MTQLRTRGAAVDAVPPITSLVPTGGTEGMVRTFNAAAAAQAVGIPASAPEPEQAADAAAPCLAIHGECAGHDTDQVNGDVYHRTTAHGVSGPFGDDLLLHNLIQVNSEKPRLEFCNDGDWTDLDLAGADALIAAVERQLASLRDCRAHLAAALGEAPPTQPPESPEARPADGATGTEAQA